MPLNADISTALQLLEHIQHTIDVSDDAKLQAQTSEDLNLLISVLENPILRGIVSVQVRSISLVCMFNTPLCLELPDVSSFSGAEHKL
jgi:multiple PDZ domain protein